MIYSTEVQNMCPVAKGAYQYYNSNDTLADASFARILPVLNNG